MAEYRLTPAAEQDLEAIWIHTAQHWSVAAFASLARSPRTVPACDHIRPGYRRRSVEQHMIYFRITSYGIAIVRVLHQRMDAPRYL